MNDRREDRPQPDELGESTDKELIDLLLVAVGRQLPQGLPEEIVARGAQIVEPLCEILLRQDLWEAEEVVPGLWAPIHALYLLGEIASPRAAPALIELLRQPERNDYIDEIVPTSLGRMGPEALELIQEFMRDRTCDPVLRAAIGGGALVHIGRRHPEHRQQIASFFTALLSHEDEGLGFATFLVVATQSIVDTELEAAVEVAFQRGDVELWVIDQDDVSPEARAVKEPWFYDDAERDLMADLHSLMARTDHESWPEGSTSVDAAPSGEEEYPPTPAIIRPPPRPTPLPKPRLRGVIPSRKRSGKKGRKARNRRRR